MKQKQAFFLRSLPVKTYLAKIMFHLLQHGPVYTKRANQAGGKELELTRTGR